MSLNLGVVATRSHHKSSSALLSASAPRDEGLGALEQRIASSEANLKEITALLAGQRNTCSTVSSLNTYAQQVQKQIQEARESRVAFEKKVEMLQAQLRQQRKEREAWLSTFSSTFQTKLKHFNRCIDENMSARSKLSRSRRQVADTTMRHIVAHLNENLSSPQEHPKLEQSSAASLQEKPTAAVWGQSSTASNSTSNASRTLSTAASSPALGDSRGAMLEASCNVSPTNLLHSLLEENKLLQQRQQALLMQKRYQSHSPLPRPTAVASVVSCKVGGDSSGATWGAMSGNEKVHNGSMRNGSFRWEVGLDASTKGRSASAQYLLAQQ